MQFIKFLFMLTICALLVCVSAVQAGYIDNGNGTVTDTGTGLMWQQASEGMYTWEQALAHCENLTLANESDWRLPTVTELSSILDTTRVDPSINITYFPDTKLGDYWTSSTVGSFYAWYVNFRYGHTDYWNKAYTAYVRAVRSALVDLIISKSGTGSVASTDGKINCGNDCSEAYMQGTSVILTASAPSGSTFNGWNGGGCSGTGDCTVIMDIAKSVTAYFAYNAANLLSNFSDFNGDGKADILWRNDTTGDVYMMLMDGMTIISQGYVYYEHNLDWKVVAIGDFNGDGKSDILWRNATTGAVYMMLMDGMTITSQSYVYYEPNLDWKIVAIGDYNGDDKADILWRNDTTGAVYMMLMDWFLIADQGYIYYEPNLDWKIIK